MELSNCSISNSKSSPRDSCGPFAANKLNLSNIVQVRVYWDATPVTLNVSITGFLDTAPIYSGSVDQFGQYSYADWPGKAHNDTEIVNQHSSGENFIFSFIFSQKRNTKLK